MTTLQAFRRYWWVTASITVIVLASVLLLERGGAPSYSASGTIMIARPEVDPSRVASRAVSLTSAIAATSTAEAREAFAADGGRSDFRIIQVSDNRLQVLASDEGSVPGTRAVLRALADEVAQQQLDADVEPSERIRPRLFLQIPESELGSIAAVEGGIEGDPPEVVGTLVLEDPFAGAENPLGGIATATRLVLVRINSDAGRDEILSDLPAGAGFDIRATDRRARELLTVTTTGDSRDDALAAFDVVTAAVEGELDRRQDLAGVPSDTRLLVDVVAAPIDAVPGDTGLGGRTLVVLVLGLGLALVAPMVLREFLPGGDGGAATFGSRPASGDGDDTGDSAASTPIGSGAPSP